MSFYTEASNKYEEGRNITCFAVGPCTGLTEDPKQPIWFVGVMLNQLWTLREQKDTRQLLFFQRERPEVDLYKALQ